MIPEDWSKGIVEKLPKKGDKGKCDNWRGITLLSIPGKILCRIILKRTDKAIDSKIREEQARTGREKLRRTGREKLRRLLRTEKNGKGLFERPYFPPGTKRII